MSCTHPDNMHNPVTCRAYSIQYVLYISSAKARLYGRWNSRSQVPVSCCSRVLALAADRQVTIAHVWTIRIGRSAHSSRIAIQTVEQPSLFSCRGLRGLWSMRTTARATCHAA